MTTKRRQRNPEPVIYVPIPHSVPVPSRLRMLFIVTNSAGTVSRNLALFLTISLMAGASRKITGDERRNWAGSFYWATVIGMFIVASTTWAEETVVSAPEPGWVRLFDGSSFAGWYTKVQNHRKNDDPGKVFQIEDGAIHLQLDPGASLLLRTFEAASPPDAPHWFYSKPVGEPIELSGTWSVKFLEGGPALPKPFETRTLASWTWS